MIEIQVKDQTAGGTILGETIIKLESERITLRDLITARVESEVEKFNSERSTIFNGLIQPNDTETQLNGYGFKKHKSIDAEKQVYVALDSFVKNGFFVFVDDNQVTELDEELMMSSNSTVSFLKLTPLVGG